MRKTIILLPCLAGLFLSCEDFRPAGSDTAASIQWSIDRETDLFTRSGSEIPDTNDFILTVADESGTILYNGPYGESPEDLSVGAGSYTVDVVSEDFTAPAFAKPQYGDTQVIVVRSGQKARATLRCTLRNAGIRLKIKEEFLTTYPRGVLFLKSADGKLMYSFSEKRIAYFKPGAVSLILSDGGTDRLLLTRHLEAQEILTLHLSAPGSGDTGSAGLSILVDTTKTWRDEQFTIGDESGSGSGNGSGGSAGSDVSSALSVTQAQSSAGAQDVWVCGYIVGGDLTATGSKMNTGPTFTKNTHLAIASRASVTEKTSCVAVELKSGPIRDALNLVDHPDLVGTRLYIKGDIVESYFGITGVKNATEYVVKKNL